MARANTRRQVLAGALALLPAVHAGPSLASGAQQGVFTLATPLAKSRGVRVWWRRPAGAHPNSPIIVVLHGMTRNAEEYLEAWAGHADAAGAVILAPEFDERSFPTAAEYNQGWMQDWFGRERPAHLWSFNLVEQAFDAYVRQSGSTQAAYRLFGHSAGAQFVHRFMLFMPQARVEQAVAANAGWYTMPVRSAAFPYGLGGASLSDAQLASALARPMVILLGAEDDDPDAPGLRTTHQAGRQGRHRVARGQRFFATARAEAARLGTPFGWSLQTAPGVGHEHARMASAAAQLLLGPDPHVRVSALGEL